MAIGQTVAAAVLSAALTVLGAGSAQTPASRQLDSDAATPDRAWSWPLMPVPSVVRTFDPPDQPWLAGHRGVDLQGAVGQVVHAPAAGRISFAGKVAGRGVVVVTHPNGLRSTFEPVRGAAKVGSALARGDGIGTLESTPGHCAPATCLHWGVLRDRTYLDPLAMLGLRPVILLPLP